MPLLKVKIYGTEDCLRKHQLGPEVGPYSLFWGLGSLYKPLQNQKGHPFFYVCLGCSQNETL